MPTRLVLLCAGATASLRAARFPDPAEPLDEGGRAKVRAFARDRAWPAQCWVSPATAARETAAILDVAGAEEPALRDIGGGAWAGRDWDAIGAVSLAAWLAAPEQGAPGGEDMAAVQARVGAWLDGIGDGHGVAITHAAVIRAAIAHALGVPVAATLAIDVAPLAMLVLSRHGRWRMQELRRA